MAPPPAVPDPGRRASLSRRALLAGAGATATAIGLNAWWRGRAGGRRPNLLLILSDDQGYNDLGCTWSPGQEGAGKIETPHLDRLAREGVRCTQFSVAAAVCTPSRAALLTGCYPPRVGFAEREGVGVLTPTSTDGLHPDEWTLADALSQVGYRTAAIGKWHLGHRAEFLPTRQGFQDFYGIPYSHNQRPLPLMRQEEVLRWLPEEPLLVGAFTQAALTFLDQVGPSPFFLYLAHTAPHEPWTLPEARSARASGRGAYGELVRWMDEGIGAVLDHLDRRGLAEDTLVLFLSDNGPWLPPQVSGGSAWPFRGGKAEPWEGGFRSPLLLRWPGVLPAGQVSSTWITALDLLPTLSAWLGAPPPPAPIDGLDLGRCLTEDAPSPREDFAYYARGRLEAVRDARHKLVFDNPLREPPTLRALYDLQEDPAETTDRSHERPEAVAHLEAIAERYRARLGDALTGSRGSERRRDPG